MIYVPDITNYKCFVVRSEEVIRAYKEIPTNDSEVAYRDYYYNSNYLYNDGVQSFSTYSTLPTCLDNSSVSNDFVYRNDFDSILIIFLIMVIFCVYLPFKIFTRFFGRWLKL